MRTLSTGAVAVALLAASSAAAFAATFTGSFALSGEAFSDPGLVIQARPASGPVSFGDLDLGESATVDLFDVWTNEGSVEGDDRVPNAILASFALSQPVAAGGLSGTVVGAGFVFQEGRVTWSNPLVLSFGAGGSGKLEISLSNEDFNEGFFGLDRGRRNGATVQATATYITAPVPLPASALLLAGGLAAFGAVRRRKAG